MSNFQAMKIRVGNLQHSIEIQKALFELGYKWPVSQQSIAHTDELYIIVDTDGLIWFTLTESYFIGECAKLVTLQDLNDLLRKQNQGIDKVSTPILSIQHLMDRCKEAYMDVMVSCDNVYHVSDRDTEGDKMVNTLQDVLELLEAKIKYLEMWRK